jgi:hypothetical protein
MKVLHEIQTYNPRECTSTGFDVQIRDNDSVKLVYHTCWQGSRSGETWVVSPIPKCIREAMDAENEDRDDVPDIETAVHDWLQTAWMDTAKHTRRGFLIK